MQSSLMSGGGGSCKRRLKGVVAQHIRQVPCLHAVIQPILNKFKCFRTSKYQTLGQEEDDDGSEVSDERQNVNEIFGQVMTRSGVFLMIGVTVLLFVRNSGWQPPEYYETTTPASTWGNVGITVPDFDKQEFTHDAPLVLYIGAVEVLICGACAHTAAAMYKRRRHALKHPADWSERERRAYVKVQLEKDVGLEDLQLYGLSFRPSTDGLEVLIVEGVRKGSLLDRWNMAGGEISAEELIADALGDDEEDEGMGKAAGRPDVGHESVSGSGTTADSPAREASATDSSATTARDNTAATSARTPRSARQVHPFSVVVAVNESSADVGMMQAQLRKPKVTLWVRAEISHACQFDENVIAIDRGDAEAPPGAEGTVEPVAPPAGRPEEFAAGSSYEPPSHGGASASSSHPGPTFYGRADGDVDEPAGGAPVFGGAANSPTGNDTLTGPSCVCFGLEDEEPQILMRWTVCGIIFGWVTLLPVLLMQPHPERPRQQLFRQFLLKPCLFIVPMWILMWLLDTVEVLIHVQIMHPFWYFSICHMLLPAALVWYLMQLQAADERLILEQRKSRSAEAKESPPLCIEDPSPTFLKELITVNPVALIWMGSCAAIPLVVCSMLTPMETKRAKMAQGYVHIMYGPLVVSQVLFLVFLWHISFEDLPKMYIAGFGLVLSIPCFLVWCVCFICASRYGRQDLSLVEQQRLERGRAAKQAAAPRVATPTDGEAGNTGVPDEQIVDCSEARYREWELIYTA